MAGRRGLAGVEEQGTRAGGSSRNLGALVISIREASGEGNPVNKPPGRVNAPLGEHAVSKERAADGTAKRRQRSAAGRVTRSRNAL